VSGQDEMTDCIAVMSEGSDSTQYLVCFECRISRCVTGLFRILSGQDEMTVCYTVT
jgi:hypothetical protein